MAINNTVKQSLNTSQTPYTFINIVRGFNKEQSNLFRICDSDSQITSNSQLFRPVPFSITLGEVSMNQLNDITLTLPNITIHSYNFRDIINTLTYIRINLINEEFPNDLIHDDTLCFLRAYTINENYISLSLDLNFELEKAFPKHLVNKVDDPEFYLMGKTTVEGGGLG